jgi:hypothetical protein
VTADRREPIENALADPDAATHWQVRRGNLDPGQVADALLPLVDALCAEAASKALLDAADELLDSFYGGKPMISGWGARHLRTRAAAMADGSTP